MMRRGLFAESQLHLTLQRMIQPTSNVMLRHKL